MRPQPRPASRRGWERLRVPERYLRRLALVAVILIVVPAFFLQTRLPESEAVAYPAVFLISLVGNATVFVPVPVFLSVCSGGVLLNPLFVGLVAGVGQALGETTGYLAGFSGSGLVKNTRVYARVQPWMQRRGWIAIIVLAAIPNPIFDVVGLAAGAMRMPLWQFLVATWVGKTVRSIAIAYGCSLGYDFFHVLSETAG